MKDNNSLAHTQPGIANIILYLHQSIEEKYFGERRLEIGAILRSLCEWKGVKIIGRGVSRSRTYAC